MRCCSSSSTPAPASSERTCPRFSSRSSRRSCRGGVLDSASRFATGSSPSTGGASRWSRSSALDRTSRCTSRWDEDLKILVGDGVEGLRLSTGGHYDLLVLDLRLPSLSGLEVLRTLRDRGDGLPVLVLTAQDAVDFKVQAL